jgi:hypothetical protein
MPLLKEFPLPFGPHGRAASGAIFRHFCVFDPCFCVARFFGQCDFYGDPYFRTQEAI